MPDAAEILKAYISRSIHVGQAAEYLAMDLAVALDELDELRARTRDKVSFGYLRAGLATATEAERENLPEPL